MRRKADDTSEKHEYQDHGCAVEEKSIRQHGDDRVCPGIENPVVIVKKDMVESDKGPFPVHADTESQDSRDDGRKNGSQF